METVIFLDMFIIYSMIVPKVQLKLQDISLLIYQQHAILLKINSKCRSNLGFSSVSILKYDNVRVVPGFPSGRWDWSNLTGMAGSH